MPSADFMMVAIKVLKAIMGFFLKLTFVSAKG